MYVTFSRPVWSKMTQNTSNGVVNAADLTHLRYVTDAVDKESIIGAVAGVPVLQQVRLQGVVGQDAKRTLVHLLLLGVCD